MHKRDDIRAAVYAKRRRNRSLWKKTVQAMACVVVFCTTYALILPAITMEQDYFCGMEEHEHSRDCYQLLEHSSFCCTVDQAVHCHDSFCLDQAGNRVCTLEEREAHIHGPECYTLVPGHTHTEECYTLELVETTDPETGEPGEPIEEQVCICQMEESGDREELVCTEPELAQHQHGEGCWELTTEELLVCQLPEHIHSYECESDPEADLESRHDWESTFSHLELSGSWAVNMADIAQTQIGYGESRRNYLVDGGGVVKGYSRYGAWNGTPYAKWNAAFASFCMDYAGVPEKYLAEKTNPAHWMEQLQELELLQSAENAEPCIGDLVFFQNGEDLAAGITSRVDAGYWLVIAGDIEDRVQELEVKADQILWICDVRVLQQTEEAAEATEATEATEETEASQPSETTEATEATEASEPTGESEAAGESTEAAEAVPENRVFTAETENYIVTVSCGAELVLPEGTRLRVVEYPKDSPIFLLRCQQAGYELEWLLNIGFFLDDTELEPEGDFTVVVTSKQGLPLGSDITHFAESGTEHISGTTESQEDGSAVSFSSGGFSDFGGGIALAAAQTATVNLNLYSYSQWNPINFAGGNTITCQVGSTITLTVSDSGANPYTPNLTVTGGQLVSQTYACGEHGWDHGGWCGNNPVHTIVIKVTDPNVTVSGQINGSNWNNSSYTVTPPESGGTTDPVEPEPTDPPQTDPTEPSETEPTEPSETEPTEPTEPEIDTSYPNYPNYPHAVHTGSVSINRLRFYNLCEGDGGIRALAGCVFEIVGDNGYTATITSGDAPEINLPANIPDGAYTITEVSVPEGFLRDTRYQREFWIQDGMLASEHNIGTFINHNVSGLMEEKHAQVYDYTSRIYEVLLEAEADLRMYEMEPIDVLFVVDRSNSMLFPSAMSDTGYDITLNLYGTDNVTRNQAVFDALDKHQVYYIVADPEGSATAWAIWYDGNHWMCQDSSYYAKAKHDNAVGYQTPGELAIFPEYKSYGDQPTQRYGQTVRANGAGLDQNLQGSSLGKHLDSSWNDTRTYTLYTAKDQYNRLHYLEEALANIIYALADANPKNRVTLVPFTKTVQTSIEDPENPGSYIQMPAELSTSNARKLVHVVTHIDTSGGTRQDLALEYTYNNYLRYDQDGKKPDHTYTILITDGAPVESDDKSLSAIYTDITNFGGSVKQESVLMSVALGMDTVVGGSSVLKGIATSDEFYCALEDASELIETMQEILFKGFTRGDRIYTKADLIDEITDSFYPLAWTEPGNGENYGREVVQRDPDRDWIILQPGDWITREGKLTVSGTNRAGQLQRREDGTFYIQWEAVVISDEGGWDACFFVKAKEDFIGGNAIHTNKKAQITINVDATPLEEPLSVTVDLPKPTVNVRLLDMNEHSSEVTVYLGDLVNSTEHSPLESVRIFYEDTLVEKILSGLGDVKNKVEAAQGLEESVFDLEYALGRKLSAEEWQSLADGQSVIIPYLYDNASSGGPVGEFIFRLESSGIAGAEPSFEIHEATAACQPNGDPLTRNCRQCAERYTLYITYDAYGLGENGRPAANAHNGPNGPGTEVGTGQTLETGLGTVAKENVHEVHVISGSIRIWKAFEEGVTSDVDQTFTFTLHREEDGTDSTHDAVSTITIPAGQSAGASAITFSNLRRGTYTVTEAPHEIYMVKEVTVTDATNVFSTPAIGESGRVLSFVMGSNTDNINVIGYAGPAERYTGYLDPVNGVYGEALFTNQVIVYHGDIPVEKLWDDGSEVHEQDAVYLVLYLDDAPVLDEQGNGRILRLDAGNQWRGSFQVVLADKEDVVANYNYAVREVFQASEDTDYQPIWNKALLENDGETILYYDRTLSPGQVLAVRGKAYVVQYSAGEDGTWTVTNHRGTELPMTGGVGTQMYTTSGLLLIAAALIIGCSQRRKRERRAG